MRAFVVGLVTLAGLIPVSRTFADHNGSAASPAPMPPRTSGSSRCLAIFDNLHGAMAGQDTQRVIGVFVKSAQGRMLLVTGDYYFGTHSGLLDLAESQLKGFNDHVVDRIWGGEIEHTKSTDLYRISNTSGHFFKTLKLASRIEEFREWFNPKAEVVPYNEGTPHLDQGINALIGMPFPLGTSKIKNFRHDVLTAIGFGENYSDQYHSLNKEMAKLTTPQQIKEFYRTEWIEHWKDVRSILLSEEVIGADAKDGNPERSGILGAFVDLVREQLPAKAKIAREHLATLREIGGNLRYNRLNPAHIALFIRPDVEERIYMRYGGLQALFSELQAHAQVPQYQFLKGPDVAPSNTKDSPTATPPTSN